MFPKMQSAFLFAFVALTFHGTATAADYVLKQKFLIGGEGGWDYLTYDSADNRLFISRETHVQVVDPRTGAVLADIPDTPGVHGIALAPELGKGYTSNGRENSVTVFDLKTLKTIAKIKIEGGDGPDSITFDSVSKRVVTFNGRSRNASVIDADTDTLVATIPLNGKPESAIADGHGIVFVDIEDKNEIAAIDARKATVVSRWPLGGCSEPAGLAMDVKARRLFAGCHNKMMSVVNADNGKIVAALPIGEGVDANAFDAAMRLIFSSQGDGTLTVIHEDSADKFTVLQNAVTQRGARTMALNPMNHDVYLVSAEFEDASPVQGQQRVRRAMKPGTFALIVMTSK